MEQGEFLENRAVLNRGEIEDHADCEECMEDYIFALKDRVHEFSIGLSTILECLAIAEKDGAVPKIEEGWWIEINNRY